MQKDEIAAAVVLTMKAVIAPIQERLRALEVQADTWITSTDTLLTFTRELAPVRERLTALETRPQQAGPPGKDGEPGPPGPPGTSFTFTGPWTAGKTYEPGQVVVWDGSAWHCNGATDHRPGDGTAAWTLICKRGKDGRDGKDGGR